VPIPRRLAAPRVREGHQVMELTGQRIVVLGGTSGIGLGVAQATAAAGGTVIVASRQQSSVEEALRLLPATAEGHAVDLRNEAAIEGFFAQVGAFDHLVYTAGETLQIGPITDVDLAAAHAFFETRYWGAYTAAKHAAPRLRPGGSITFTSGSAGIRPRSGWSLGASICAAMEGLTRALAVELAPLRVNIGAPGLVRSPLWRDIPEEARNGMYETASQTLPVGRVGEPEDLAQAYLFLMRQGFATGQRVVVDGGYSLG
jgi:NAD(P)-dependent dehydrogenase (short-subunit alcohol dehydrogenase family)